MVYSDTANKQTSEEQGFQSITERIPPQNLEAEEAILGSILLDPEAITRVSDFLKVEAFYLSIHREIYQTALMLQSQGKPTDLTTMAAWLQDQGKLEQIGGQGKLAQLVDRIISTANVDQYAELVMDKYFRRQLIKVGNQVIALGYDTKIPLSQVLQESEQKIFALTQDRPRGGLTATAEILTHTFNEIESRSLGTALSGIPCNFYDLDGLTQGFQRSDLIIVAGRPAMGKCLAYDSEIVLSDGSIHTIAEIYHAQQQAYPQRPTLLTLRQDWRLALTQPSQFVDDGIKPVFRVMTRLGRSIETTLTHPFLTLGGWKPLAELQAGCKIAVPRMIPIFGQKRLPEAKVKLLAYLIRGKDSYQKSVPSIIFELTQPQISLFINRLFATDGWITVLNSGQVQLGYSSMSEKLMRQLQHLLLRFGIIGSLKQRQIKYQEDYRTTWQLDITDGRSIQTFIDQIGIFGKEKAIAQAQETLAHKGYHTNRDLIPVEIWSQLAVAKGSESWQSLAKRSGIQGSSNIHVGQRAISRDRLGILSRSLQNLELENLAISDIYWDEIVSIELMGYKQVYDLTIPETHNFVANDICVHNTSFVLNIARNIAVIHRLPVCIYSLEMSKEQLVYRLLSSEVGIESGRLRSGRITTEEWGILGQAMGNLSELPIYIDDTPDMTVNEMRSKARRLQSEQGGKLGLVLIDYLQLMEGASPDNRVQELSKITRSLKSMARELNAPVMTLSQLSRGVESRTNKRPMMSDLRESGCLSGDTLVTLADTGGQVAIRDLVGHSGFKVWALNEQTCQLESAVVSRVFSTGTKPIYALKTRLGRTIKATGNHKFLTIEGWRSLDELQIGQHLALPRYLASALLQLVSDAELALLGHLIGDGCTLPRHTIQYTTREVDLAGIVSSLAVEVFGDQINPRISRERSWYQVYLTSANHLTHQVRNPISKWLDELGIFGLRSYEKFIPDVIFQQPQESIALFLRHLWSTDGSIKLVEGQSPRPIAYYASSSQRLAMDVQSLLVRLGINARLSKISQSGKGRDQYHVTITGKPDLERFIVQVGAVGCYKQNSLSIIAEHLKVHAANTNRDIIPSQIWKKYVIPVMKKCGLTHRQMQSEIGMSYCGHSLYQQNVSRDRAAKVARVVNSSELLNLATSDIYWDQICSIDPVGETEVYDLTVPGLHNFVANNMVVHNSIEQDADLIIMLYRDEYYNPDSVDRGLAEVIITKHRNGPVGTVKLLFEPQFTRFRNLANPL